MRNGNSGVSLQKIRWGDRSYPTYEEWKLNKKIMKIFGAEGSYPTYEEWKHLSINEIINVIEEFLSYL